MADYAVPTMTQVALSELSTAHRAFGRRRLESVDVLLALLALTGGLRLVHLAAGKPDFEAQPVARVFALSHLQSYPGMTNGASSPFGWAQLAGYDLLTRAFVRQSPVNAVREAAVVAALGIAVLLWLLARRAGLPSWVATITVAVLAVSPLAIGVQRLALTENLAVLWLLAALLLIYTPGGLGRDLLIPVFLLAAVLTSPLAFAMLPTAGWLLVRRRDPDRAVTIGVTFTLGLGIAFGPAAGLLRPSLGPGSGLAAWVGLDPVVVTIAVVVSVASLWSRVWRPFGVGMLLLAVAALWQGPGGLTLAMPFALLTTAGTVRAAALARSPRRRKHSGRQRRFSIPLVIAVYLVIAATAASWINGYAGLRTKQPPSPVSDAAQWLRDNASGSRVLTDDAGWTELAAAGWPTGSLMVASNCATDCETADWVLSTPALRDQVPALPGLATVLTFAKPAARFDEVEVSRISIVDVVPAAREQGSRARAGAMLAASPRIQLLGDADTLRGGRVDPRLLATIAAYVSLDPLKIVALPAIPGEDSAGQPRRKVVLTGDDPARIAQFFGGQRDIYRPAAVATADGRVTVTYSLFPPGGLLAPFDTP
ncbi:glycosyl transferase [Amycolatopsis sp. NPDC059657]|uniref:glycosyl transferase n=1 Tax=Amycolatopsis sp. NPDC059657 TaxID=3346899 RepID=UPI00366D4CA8